MLEKDGHLRYYGLTLIVCVGMIAGAFTLTPPSQEWANMGINTPNTGAIETGSIPSSVSPTSPQAWNYPEIPWRSYEDGMARMAMTGQPAVLVLQADWCLRCRSYQDQFGTSAVETFAEDYVFILVDVDARPDVQLRYNIDGDYVPRTFVLTPEGDLATRQTGSDSTQRFFVDPSSPDELSRLLARF